MTFNFCHTHPPCFRTFLSNSSWCGTGDRSEKWVYLATRYMPCVSVNDTPSELIWRVTSWHGWRGLCLVCFGPHFPERFHSLEIWGFYEDVRVLPPVSWRRSGFGGEQVRFSVGMGGARAAVAVTTYTQRRSLTIWPNGRTPVLIWNCFDVLQ